MAKTAKVLSVAALGAALGAATATSASAQGPGGGDLVELADGGALHGKVTQQVPGSYVVIQTDDGRIESIPWSQVRRVSAGVVVAPPPPPPPPLEVAPGMVALEPPAPYTAPKVHFELGARIAYAFASGDYLSGVSLGSASLDTGVPSVQGAVPLTLDLGVRIGRYLNVGGFLSYAPLMTSPPSLATAGTVSSGGHDVRAGIEAQLHFAPRGAVDPWIGVGFGREWLDVTLNASAPDGSTASVSQTFEGWNFGDLMLGVDFRSTGGLGVGPYIEMTGGSFESVSASASATGAAPVQASSNITNGSGHQWFMLGVHGTYEVL